MKLGMAKRKLTRGERQAYNHSVTNTEKGDGARFQDHQHDMRLQIPVRTRATSYTGVQNECTSGESEGKEGEETRRGPAVLDFCIFIKAVSIVPFLRARRACCLPFEQYVTEDHCEAATG